MLETEPTFIDYLETYAAAIEHIYSMIRMEIYPDNGEECAYKNVEESALQQAVSERFSFLTITSATLGVVDTYVASLKEENKPEDYDPPQETAILKIQEIMDSLRMRVLEQSYIEALENEATVSLGKFSLAGLHLGTNTGIEFLDSLSLDLAVFDHKKDNEMEITAPAVMAQPLALQLN